MNNASFNYLQYVNSIITHTSDQNQERKFHLIKLLGSGGEGAVFQAKQLDRREENVALKLQSKIREHESNFIDYLIGYHKELDIIPQKVQPNIIRIYERFIWNQFNVIIMELGSIDLFNYIIEKRFVLEKDQICNQISQPINFLHQMNIMHRDIKPENFILVGKSFKLIDFGLIKKISEKLQTPKIGTPLYQSPEILESLDYSFSHDIWSLGCIFYEIYQGTALFQGKDLSDVQLRIQNHALNPIFINTQIKQLIKQTEIANLIISMLNPDPNQRPSSKQVVDQLTEILAQKQKPFQFQSNFGNTFNQKVAPFPQNNKNTQPSFQFINNPTKQIQQQFPVFQPIPIEKQIKNLLNQYISQIYQKNYQNQNNPEQVQQIQEKKQKEMSQFLSNTELEIQNIKNTSESDPRQEPNLDQQNQNKIQIQNNKQLNNDEIQDQSINNSNQQFEQQGENQKKQKVKNQTVIFNKPTQPKQDDEGVLTTDSQIKLDVIKKD